jgi:hypothetical protein
MDKNKHFQERKSVPSKIGVNPKIYYDFPSLPHPKIFSIMPLPDDDSFRGTDLPVPLWIFHEKPAISQRLYFRARLVLFHPSRHRNQ